MFENPAGERDFASDSFIRVLSKLQTDPPSPFDSGRAMAGQVEKVVVPSIHYRV